MVKHSSIRILLALVAQFNIELVQLDVKTSFLHGDLDKRRSTMGYLFTMAGELVCWRSTLQSTIALSTTGAEYMVVTEAFKEAIWMHSLINDLGILHNI